MAIKSTLLFLAFVLLVTRMGSATEAAEIIQTQHHHGHRAKAPAMAPVHPPAEAPIHAPTKAPVHASAKAPVAAPANSPVCFPPKSPVFPPVHGCVAMCFSHCKTISPKRPCMRTCTACCAKCKCVPGFTECSNWTSVMIHGSMVKCP